MKSSLVKLFFWYVNSYNINHTSVSMFCEISHRKPLFPEIWLEYTETIRLALTCSKLTIETLEQGVKYVQS